MSSTVYIHYGADGIPLYCAQGDVDIIVVDDNCPDDRVFKHSRVRPPQDFLDSLKGCKIGTHDDARQKKLEADLQGKSHLTEVSDDQTNRHKQ